MAVAKPPVHHVPARATRQQPATVPPDVEVHRIRHRPLEPHLVIPPGRGHARERRSGGVVAQIEASRAHSTLPARSQQRPSTCAAAASGPLYVPELQPIDARSASSPENVTCNGLRYQPLVSGAAARRDAGHDRRRHVDARRVTVERRRSSASSLLTRHVRGCSRVLREVESSSQFCRRRSARERPATKRTSTAYQPLQSTGATEQRGVHASLSRRRSPATAASSGEREGGDEDCAPHRTSPRRIGVRSASEPAAASRSARAAARAAGVSSVGAALSDGGRERSNAGGRDSGSGSGRRRGRGFAAFGAAVGCGVGAAIAEAVGAGVGAGGAAAGAACCTGGRAGAAGWVAPGAGSGAGPEAGGAASGL